MQWKQEYINTVKTLAKQGLSSSKIGEAMFEQYNINFSGRTIRRYAQGVEKDTTNVRGVELTINQDGSQTSITRIQMTSEQAKDPDFVLRAHGFDSTKWDIISLKNNFWQMGSKDSDPVDLYQSKVTVKPRVVKFNVDDLIETLNRNVKPIEVKNIQQGETSLVISLFDLHFGITKLNMLKSHINQIGNILKKGYKRVEIIVGGDVLHSDFITKTQTSSNTQLDHVKTIKALNEAESFISTIIEMSLQYSPTVEVKAVSGNHDTDSQYLFIWGMSKKYPQVEFDNELNTERLAFSFDKVGIMVAHGNLALKRLPMLFANEYPDIWARSRYRMVASGHFHTEKKTDVDGVMMWQFGTTKPNDPYEKANGYTMGRKHLQLLEFCKERLLATYEVE